ncbi:bile acid transporter [Phaeobacter sp. CECT 5382]|uniref:bile acid:sodium symporter family protein n=1 Tax=Phaeobacter sp. CECT 5382 TaxID=1712645 RepID=UPI0006DB7009|nr:bile acid:sodium symporter family protein [Phaeobacter sp. CECT 5382]CUH87321.1 bile acid transporter [Phaeobacter sp. CECT 5382]
MSDIDDIFLNFSPTSLVVLNAVLAIVMFSVALDLKTSDFARLMRAPKPVLTGLVSQFVILPALTFLLVSVMQPRASIALGLILVAACPGGNISNFITQRAGGNAALSVSMTAFATIGAILFTPLNIAFWGGLYEPTRAILTAIQIAPRDIAVTVTLMLILPLILGMALNSMRPQLAGRIRRPLQNLSMVIFLAFIVLALAANWDFFLGYAHYVALLVVLHNTVALAGGYATATVARLSAYDRRAVTIETGIQNSGLGLVLIFGFFGGLGGMAVVAAFWGIWHAISGIALARVMSRVEAQR